MPPTCPFRPQCFLPGHRLDGHKTAFCTSEPNDLEKSPGQSDLQFNVQNVNKCLCSAYSLSFSFKKKKLISNIIQTQSMSKKKMSTLQCQKLLLGHHLFFTTDKNVSAMRHSHPKTTRQLNQCRTHCSGPLTLNH